MNEALKNRLSALGLPNTQIIQKITNSIGASTGAAFGFSGNMDEVPEFASILGEQMPLANKIDNALAKANIRHVVDEGAWYIVAAPGESKPILRGFNEDAIEIVGSNQAKITTNAFDKSTDLTVISDGRAGIVIDDQTMEVHVFKFLEDSDSAEEQTGSSTLATDALEFNITNLVTESDDPWLHTFLGQYVATNTRPDILWALRAFLRYRLPEPGDDDLLKHFKLPESVVSARKQLKKLREGHDDTLISVVKTKAEKLRERLSDAYDRAFKGEDLTTEEWRSFCVDRENLLVAMQTLRPSSHTTTLADVVDDIDELGYMVLTESNASGIAFESEQLWRGILAGNENWWLRAHRLEK